ncbi:MAG: thiamine pyrophosphate-dependent dehydrogenase E1 component subunit alpha [Jatrophihabitantaceae bacterium]
MIQLLTPGGVRVEDPTYPLDISTDEIAALYRDLVLVRCFDTEAIALQRQGELGLWTSLLGQEAAQIGAGRALRPHDMAFPSYREHGVAWCRGMDPLDLLGMWRGSSGAGWSPHAHNFGTYTIVIGAQTLHAVGYAMGVVRDGDVGTGAADRDTAVLVFLGDGAMSQGDVSEAFAWAASMSLPVVFFCQNNQWAISAPVDVQSRVPLFERAAGFGFPGVQVDGNDVLASLAVTRRALDVARAGNGPTLIEAYTYRMNPHTTSDDARRYRVDDEVESWRARDPITRVRAYLERETGVRDGFFDSIADEAEKLAFRVRTGGRALADVTPAALFDDVYVDMPDELAHQRSELMELLAREIALRP